MVIDGAAVLITILSAFVLLPALFVALTVKLNVPTVVGVPDISPVFGSRDKPGGRLPLSLDQFIGTVPVALRVVL